jgi:hypothetical protein
VNVPGCASQSSSSFSILGPAETSAIPLSGQGTRGGLPNAFLLRPNFSGTYGDARTDSFSMTIFYHDFTGPALIARFPMLPSMAPRAAHPG